MSQVNESGVVIVNRDDMAKRVRAANDRIRERKDLRQGVVRDAILVEPEADLDGREVPMFPVRVKEVNEFNGDFSR